MAEHTENKVKCARFYGEVKLPVKEYHFMDATMEKGSSFRLCVTKEGFYLLYGKRNFDEEKLLRSGYFISMEEGETEDGRKFEGYTEIVPDAPGDYGEGFTEIFRFFPKEEVMEHEVIPDGERY
jgi:hypothetical protein